MSISLYTLLGQILTFAVLVWFIKRFLWAPLLRIMEDRKRRIADGLAAGERGKHEQLLAEQRAREILVKTKEQAAEVIARAEKRAGEIIDEAKQDARLESGRMIVAARAEIDQELNAARQMLRTEVANIAVAGAGKVLEREIDAKAHSELLDKLAAQI